MAQISRDIFHRAAGPASGQSAPGVVLPLGNQAPLLSVAGLGTGRVPLFPKMTNIRCFFIVKLYR